METLESRGDYGPVVCATFLWACAGAFTAAALGLPLLALGTFVLIGWLWAPVSISAIASGLVATAVGALLVYSILRCTFLSFFRVWRSPGYPERHWRLLRQAFKRVLWTELILVAAVLGAVAAAYFSHGRLANRADFAVAVAGAIFVCGQLGMIAGLNDMIRHASVLPYFPRKVGDIDTFCYGKSLARHVDELDELARMHGVEPLSTFGWNDDLANEPIVWHSAAAGLKTVNFLLITLEREETGWDDLAATIADLKRIAHALERADAQDIPFCLLLRQTNTTSGYEWQVRKGTCF